MEEKIIEEKVGITEVNYRRLYKACQALSINEQTADVSTQVDAELTAYEALLEKFQLEINMNQKEISYYEAEKQNQKEQMEELMQQTENLKNQVEESSQLRRQKEEYNKVISEMARAKKVSMTDETLGKEVQIVAQLNIPRQEDLELISNLESEIEELKSLREQYQTQGSERKENFNNMIKSIENFRRKVVGPPPTTNNEVEDAEMADDHKTGQEEETRNEAHQLNNDNDDEVNSMDTTA